jgi:hypothetical protein
MNSKSDLSIDEQGTLKHLADGLDVEVLDLGAGGDPLLVKLLVDCQRLQRTDLLLAKLDPSLSFLAPPRYR